jgi:hypothetical protein
MFRKPVFDHMEMFRLLAFVACVATCLAGPNIAGSNQYDLKPHVLLVLIFRYTADAVMILPYAGTAEPIRVYYDGVNNRSRTGLLKELELLFFESSFSIFSWRKKCSLYMCFFFKLLFLSFRLFWELLSVSHKDRVLQRPGYHHLPPRYVFFWNSICCELSPYFSPPHNFIGAHTPAHPGNVWLPAQRALVRAAQRIGWLGHDPAVVCPRPHPLQGTTSAVSSDGPYFHILTSD